MLDRKYTGFHVLLVCLILLGVPWEAAMGQELGPGTGSGGKSVTKETCISLLGMEGQNAEQVKTHLVQLAKRDAVGELYGELIHSISRVSNFVLTHDEIQALSIGFIRVSGSPEFFNKGFGEVCTRIHAYVTEEDLERFRPKEVRRRECISDPKLTLGEIRQAAENRAMVRAVKEFRPSLESFSDKDIKNLLHEARVESSAFVADASYCAVVTGKVYPIELLALEQSTQVGQGGAEPKPLREPQEKEPGSILVDRLGGVEFKFAYIPSGTFMMGSPSNEPGRRGDEKQHRVTLTQGFYMQTTEVTQGQWKAVMGRNPSNFTNCGDQCPVETVSWNDCREFIREMNRLAGSNRYRLPTEAEWEYAARAGSSERWCFGDNERQLKEYAWYDATSARKSEPVALLKPNAWGLYDMHGNVWEWCQDWYGEYPSGSVTDPMGPASGSDRVRRGGGWNDVAKRCRSAFRNYAAPGDRYNDLGLRLARD